MKTVLLSVPGLRASDLERMPHCRKLVQSGCQARLSHSFPAVTWPSQATILTGQTPDRHGVVANGFFWREENRVEMWTAGNEVIQAPQIWDVLKQRDPDCITAAWFPMLSKRCGADLVCMPAPIHRPDGSEQMWCYTKPESLYPDLLKEFDPFPLHRFWGPMANIESTEWIARTAGRTFVRHRPDFFYIYLPHLDYAAQKMGPDSPEALAALQDLDRVIGDLAHACHTAARDILWILVCEYAIVPVQHVSYPNRMLREAGLLTVQIKDDGEHLDLAGTPAWAMVDHQFSHVFVRDRDPATIAAVVERFQGQPGFARILAGDARKELHIDHARSGDVVLVSTLDSWQAWYWWWDDQCAPSFARTVDIHRKPGYDPVELFWDPATQSTPLDATLIRGSHGAALDDLDNPGIVAVSAPGILDRDWIRDTEVFGLVLNAFSG